MNPFTLLARALDALNSRVEAIKDWLGNSLQLDFKGDELDSDCDLWGCRHSHLPYTDDLED